MIEAAATASGLSVKKLAANAGISDTRWRHIVRGWQPTPGGGMTPVIGPAPTLARMALAVGVSADQLAQTGRTDAADLLARMQAQNEGGAMPEPSTGERPQADEIDMIYASRTMPAREKLLRIRQILALRAQVDAEQVAMQPKAPASDAGALDEPETQQS